MLCKGYIYLFVVLAYHLAQGMRPPFSRPYMHYSFYISFSYNEVAVHRKA